MPLSAWVMLIFGVVVLYGGLIYCVSKTKRVAPTDKALNKKIKKEHFDSLD